MAIQLANVQPTVLNIVKGVSPFKDLVFADPDTLDAHLFPDDGTMRDAMEDSLKGVGWAIVISPPIGVSIKSQVSAASTSPVNDGSVKSEVLTVISIRTNPKKNTGTNKINLFQCISTIIKGVVSWKPSPGEHGFTMVPERPFEPDFEDVGCFSYDIRVLKNVTV